MSYFLKPVIKSLLQGSKYLNDPIIPMPDKTELKRGTALLVEWLDIKSLLGWSYSHKDPPREPGRIKSLGFLSASSDECLTLTTSMDFGHASLDDVSIPLGCIQKVTVLPEQFSRDGETENEAN